DSLKFGLIRIFNMVKSNVDQLSNIGLFPPVIQTVEVSNEPILLFPCGLIGNYHIRKNKALTVKLASDPLRIIPVLLGVRLIMVMPDIRNIFKEKRREDIILVLCRIDSSSEGITCRPGGCINF